jgi:lipopolysaccharide heptosyltransferase II
MQGVLHRTLIIRLSSIGDIILSSPLVRLLHTRFPDIWIDYLVKSQYADLVRHNPYISRVIEFPDGGTIADLMRQRRDIAASAYDLVLDIHDSIRSRILTFGLSAPRRINKRKIARTLLVFLKRDFYHRFGDAPPLTDRYLETVHDYALENDGRGPEVFLPEETRGAVDAMLAAESIDARTTCIGICPSARHGNKMWPAERFSNAAAQLAQKTRRPVLVFGSRDEIQRCSEITESLRAGSDIIRAVNLAGRTSLLETAAAMDRCAVVVANDTGLMHLASARGIPVVAIFGPTVRQFGFFPQAGNSIVIEQNNLSCRPCTHVGLPGCPRGHFSCMMRTTTAAVVDAALALLSEPGA